VSTRGSTRDPGDAPGPGLAWRLVALALKGLAFGLMFAVPLLGTWSASSLAAFWNGPIAVVVGAGLLLFPILPLAWEGLGEHRRRRAARETKKPPRARILTFGDRMILRTLVLNGSFLAVFLVGWPQAIFTALSTRGDWFLEDVEGAEGARRMLPGAADAMGLPYEAANGNP